MKDKNKKAIEKFTQIKEKLWGIGFDIYEVNIIARISSWQRDNRLFFESKDKIAKLFGCDRKVIIRRFDRLEKLQIIKRGEKIGRSWSYTIDLNNLSIAIDEGISTLEVQISKLSVPQRYNICTPEVHYNTNNKTSNKTSFIGDESALGADSHHGPTDLEIFKFAQQLDIDI